MRRVRAWPVWPFAELSKYRPNDTKVMSMVDVSKKVRGFSQWSVQPSIMSMARTLNVQEAIVPTTTSVSIVIEPWRMALYAARKNRCPTPNCTGSVSKRPSTSCIYRPRTGCIMRNGRRSRTCISTIQTRNSGTANNNEIMNACSQSCISCTCVRLSICASSRSSNTIASNPASSTASTSARTLVRW